MPIVDKSSIAIMDQEHQQPERSITPPVEGSPEDAVSPKRDSPSKKHKSKRRKSNASTASSSSGAPSSPTKSVTTKSSSPSKRRSSKKGHSKTTDAPAADGERSPLKKSKSRRKSSTGTSSSKETSTKSNPTSTAPSTRQVHKTRSVGETDMVAVQKRAAALNPQQEPKKPVVDTDIAAAKRAYKLPIRTQSVGEINQAARQRLLQQQQQQMQQPPEQRTMPTAPTLTARPSRTTSDEEAEGRTRSMPLGASPNGFHLSANRHQGPPSSTRRLPPTTQLERQEQQQGNRPGAFRMNQNVRRSESTGSSSMGAGSAPSLSLRQSTNSTTPHQHVMSRRSSIDTDLESGDGEQFLEEGDDAPPSITVTATLVEDADDNNDTKAIVEGEMITVLPSRKKRMIQVGIVACLVVAVVVGVLLGGGMLGGGEDGNDTSNQDSNAADGPSSPQDGGGGETPTDGGDDGGEPVVTPAPLPTTEITTDSIICVNTLDETWSYHDNTAQSLGGHLVSVHDMFTNTLVKNLVVEETPGQAAYIGLYNDHSVSQVNAGHMTWSDGTPVDFDDWDSGVLENLNAGASSVNPQCVALWPQGDYFWNHQDCSILKNGVYRLPTENICSGTSGFANHDFVCVNPNTGERVRPECSKPLESDDAICRTETSGTWAEQELAAIETYGGNLVSIHDADLNRIVTILSAVDRAWIGLSLDDESFSYTWSDGTPFDFEDWQFDQPKGQDCAQSNPSVNGDYYEPAWITKTCDIKDRMAIFARIPYSSLCQALLDNMTCVDIRGVPSRLPPGCSNQQARENVFAEP
eukprot:CAMPEP_0172444402 /NCGR_PEP_ID=MMETSP1065-20121228/4453_1 /TAXON_ID=265537 /ORGANISM="Amphiprora paludosa, Strain CCMP125" /LENGTH=803 /DNA_ID=CAMNT_0013194931 /DNA_START=393 /DNA_END=2804 /DNA_ORIENTATION=+